LLAQTVVDPNLNGTPEFPFTYLDQFVEANNGGSGSDNVYLLARGGTYFFTSRATWDFNVEFRADGDEMLPRPLVSRINLAGGPPQDMYRGFGDLTFDGIYLVPGDEGPEAVQYETGSIRPSGDSTQITFRNCVIEKDRQAVLRLNATNVSILFEHCEIRNLGDYEKFQGNGRVVTPRVTFPDSIIIRDCYIHNLLDRVYIGFRQVGLNYFEFTGNTVYNHIGRHGFFQMKNTRETIIQNNLFINPMMQGTTPSLANEQISHFGEQIYLFTLDTLVDGGSITMSNNNLFWNEDVLNQLNSIDSVDVPNVLSPLFAEQLENPDGAFFTEVLELNNVPSRAPLLTFAAESVATRASSGLTNIMVEPENLNTNPSNPYVFNFANYDPCFNLEAYPASATGATDGGPVGARWACTYINSAKELTYNPSLELKATPNPVQDMTQLSFHTFERGVVKLNVHDMNGRTVARLLNTELPAGLHTQEWDALRTLPAGMYLAHLQTNSGRMFIRIVKK